MIPLLSSNVLIVSFPSGRNLAFSSSPTHFTLRFDFAPISQTKLFSSSIDVAKEVDKDDSFTGSYLINSCGLSPDSAKLVSKHIQFKDPSKPDSVLDCLKNYGFSDADIKRVLRGYPKVLMLNAEKTLKPKMEFFLSIGVKGGDLPAIICRGPRLLGSSLNEKIIPCYDFLKSVLVHDDLIVKSLKNSPWVWGVNLEKNVVPNFELLKKVGVPESNIQNVLIHYCALLRLDNVAFSERVNRAIEMGFNPSNSKYKFVDAIKYWPTKSNWEHRAQLCKTRGWSDSDISFAFMKSPAFMNTSVEKFTAVMDFLMNKMGLSPSAIVAAPYAFSCSLEKNTIPKCSVIRVLQLKGLIEDDFPLSSFLPSDKKKFMDMFVFRYRQQVPELLDIFEGNVDLEELGYGFEEKLDTKLK